MNSSPLPSTEHRRPVRGEISLGDAITAVALLGAVEDSAVASVIDVLGLAVEAAAVALPLPAPPLPDRLGTRQWVDDDEDDRPIAQDGTHETPIGATVRYEDDNAVAPGWLDEVTAIRFGSIGASADAEPPLPSMQARAAMAVVAATRRPGRTLDVRRLVERASRMQPLVPPPILFELRTASFIQLLIDCGEAMEPYAADVAFLEERFVEVAGADRVNVHTFAGTPLRGVDLDVLGGAAEPWDRPPPRSLVVVLSELGVGGPPASRDRASAAEWRELATQVARCDASMRVLTPFPAARWPAGLTELVHVANWESLVNLVEHRA